MYYVENLYTYTSLCIKDIGKIQIYFIYAIIGGTFTLELQLNTDAFQ